MWKKTSKTRITNGECIIACMKDRERVVEGDGEAEGVKKEGQGRGKG